jgi:Tfp pilus assembly protein PilF
MKTAIFLTAVLSLILGTSGCQTLNDSSDNTAASDPATDLSVARAFLDSGRPDKAMYELRNVLQKNPKNCDAQSLMGLTQLALKNPKRALSHLQTAWNLEPKSQHALNLSSALIETKQYESAQKLIMKGLSLKENPPYLHKERFLHNLGLIAERKGRLDAAQKAFRKALEENPTFYLSRAHLAEILAAQGKSEDAREEWELARASCPGCLEPTVNLAKYYQLKGDFKTAVGIVNDYKKIEGLNPIEAQKASALERELMTERSKYAEKSDINRTR